MSYTDFSESGLENLIVEHLTGQRAGSDVVEPETAEVRKYGHNPNYVKGSPDDFDREHGVDVAQLLDFLNTTQPEEAAKINIQEDGPARQQFLHRLQGELTKRGIIHVLRNGIKHQNAAFDLFYGTPTPGNPEARKRYYQNIFSVTRQLKYSQDETKLALDLCLFINGLPVATFELKNKVTKQTVQDAVDQYKQHRDPNELLFKFGYCLVHFAVDDHQVKMCTHLKGKESWFLPFNKGYNNGAGNPPNPDGIATDYLWKEILTRKGLTNIIENYAQIVEEEDEETKKKKRYQVFPRYHQLDVVEKLLQDAAENGPGKRYLIEHSAGSGKSHSITWLAHQLIELKDEEKPLFDTVIVVTDRRILDQQIRSNIKQFAQVSAVVGTVTQGSAQLKQFIEQGKRIITTTVQKFPYILEEIGTHHKNRSFGIIIDEAHSSQGQKATAKMNAALSGEKPEEEETMEDQINRLMESKKMLSNASYFAFTATPKNKTLELFGTTVDEGGGELKKKPFHVYSMRQAIEEGFIEDVLRNYTPVDTYYHLIKQIEDDPEFDTKKAKKKLRAYVENHEKAIRQKAEIMVDHFLDEVLARHKMNGKARAMVITGGIEQAVRYYYAFQQYLKERKSPYQAIVAFSGEKEVDGKKVTEDQLNGFAGKYIKSSFQKHPYRFLIVANKFQTGFDEPLLHTMYVDKHLAGVQAVQTLSRLNRAHPEKYDTFILDFKNGIDTIKKAFEPYYTTTVLSEATDPNRLHDLKDDLGNYQVYSQQDIDKLVERYLSGANRERLDPILDQCVATYEQALSEDDQVDFKSKAKGFIRTYNFLATILPKDYNNAEWEKLNIFLNFLTPKLPSPKEEDRSKGILEAVNMDTYRAEAQAATQIELGSGEGEIDPVPLGGGGGVSEAQLDKLSNIIKNFNEQFGNFFDNPEKVEQTITEDLPQALNEDEAYQNAIKNADKETAFYEMKRALQKAMLKQLNDNTTMYKKYSDDDYFQRFLMNTMFELTYYGKTTNTGA